MHDLRSKLLPAFTFAGAFLMFVLEPLVDICPHAMHPSLKCTVADLLRDCKDTTWTKRWDPNAAVPGVRSTACEEA